MCDFNKQYTQTNHTKVLADLHAYYKACFGNEQFLLTIRKGNVKFSSNNLCNCEQKNIIFIKHGEYLPPIFSVPPTISCSTTVWSFLRLTYKELSLTPINL